MIWTELVLNQESHILPLGYLVLRQEADLEKKRDKEPIKVRDIPTYDAKELTDLLPGLRALDSAQKHRREAMIYRKALENAGLPLHLRPAVANSSSVILSSTAEADSFGEKSSWNSSRARPGEGGQYERE